MNKRLVTATSAVAGAIATGALALAIPALAAPAVHNPLCPSNETCAYVNYNYNGLLGYRAPGTGLANISTANRNQLSSWENLTGTNARFYYNINGGGHCVNMYEHDSATVHPGDGNPDNDQAESWAFNGGC